MSSPIYVIIDTNVVVSALLNPRSNPGIVVTEALLGCLTPVLNVEILEEYKDVLTRPFFSFDPAVVDAVIEGLRQRSVSLNAIESGVILKDPTDLKFYEVTLSALGEGIIDSFLVTGNLKHYPKENYIVNPAQMVELIRIEKALEN